MTPRAGGWEAAASLRLPQRRKHACPAAPGLCPLLTLQEGHGGSFCPLGHCLPCKSLYFSCRSPSCPPFPAAVPCWRQSAAGRTNTQSPSCLFASSPRGLAFQSGLRRKQRSRHHALPTHTHVRVAGALLINFDQISSPLDRRAGSCKHPRVSRAAPSAQLGAGGEREEKFFLSFSPELCSSTPY